MRTALINAAQIITVDTKGKNFKKGREHNDIGLLFNHAIIVEDGLITEILPNHKFVPKPSDNIIDLTGKVVLPGLIDCHTHTVFAGNRANEFDMKLKGATYEEIASKGGGISVTTGATRNASLQDLFDIATPRIEHFISLGITSLEIKSGYGLDYENELKMLRTIEMLNVKGSIDIIPTFLGAHIIPAEFRANRQDYLNLLCDELIPRIAAEKLAVFCDAFCETSAFSADECYLILSAAKKQGLKPRIHTEQFNTIGGLETALQLGAFSADHLEVLGDSRIQKLALSDTVAVALPGVSFFLRYSYAPVRKIIDAGGMVALSTDYNPGSSHIPNLHFIMSLAALYMKMTMEEAISAVTINAAKALDIQGKTGSIEIGKQGDFSVFNTNNYKDIIYTIGKNLNVMTLKNGKIVYKNKECFNEDN